MRLGALFLGLVLILGVSGALAAPAADPVEINVVMSLTGQGAFLGKQLREAMERIQATTNTSGGIAGRPLQFVFSDDQTSPQNDVQIFSQLIAKHVPVVIGPSFTAPCLSAAPLVAAHGPVMYCLSPAIHPVRGSYVFAVTATKKVYQMKVLETPRLSKAAPTVDFGLNVPGAWLEAMTSVVPIDDESSSKAAPRFTRALPRANRSPTSRVTSWPAGGRSTTCATTRSCFWLKMP